MAYFSQTVIDKLPDAQHSGWIEAALLFYDPGLEGGVEATAGPTPNAPTNAGAIWTFMYNPTALQYSRQAKYADSATLGSRVAYRQYVNTTGNTLQIGNLFMQTWFDGKSMQPLIEGLDVLMEAQFGAGIFKPPPLLSFVWGKKRFAPCVLESVNRTESAWLDGEPARMSLSMTLIEVPVDQAQLSSTDPQDLNVDESSGESGKPRTELSDAQAAQASKLAQQYLEQDPNRWSPEIQSLLQSDSYRLQTDRATGDVHMISVAGSDLGIIARSNEVFTEPDGVLTSGSITSIPRATNITLPETVTLSSLTGTTPAAGTTTQGGT